MVDLTWWKSYKYQDIFLIFRDQEKCKNHSNWQVCFCIGKRSFGREREHDEQVWEEEPGREDGGGKESVKEKTNENDFREAWLPYVDDASRFVKFRMIGQRQVPVPLCSDVQLILSYPHSTDLKSRHTRTGCAPKENVGIIVLALLTSAVRLNRSVFFFLHPHFPLTNSQPTSSTMILKMKRMGFAKRAFGFDSPVKKKVHNAIARTLDCLANWVEVTNACDTRSWSVISDVR